MLTYLLTYWTLFDHLVDYNSTSLIRSCPSCQVVYGSVAPSKLSPFVPTLPLTKSQSSSLIRKICLFHFMSRAHPAASSSHNQASNFQLIIINALDAYKKRTKSNLLAHPLDTEFQSCDSPSTILAVLQQQVQGLDQPRRSDERWARWLDPTVNVLYTLLGTLGEGVSLVCLRI